MSYSEAFARQCAEDVAHDLHTIRAARWAYRRKLESFIYRQCDSGSPMGLLAKSIKDYLAHEGDAFSDSELSQVYSDAVNDGSEHIWISADAENQRIPLAVLAADVYGKPPAGYEPKHDPVNEIPAMTALDLHKLWLELRDAERACTIYPPDAARTGLKHRLSIKLGLALERAAGRATVHADAAE